MSFTIYQASAGSGKTFSLAKEYLKIALTNPDAYKNILAITFTNKAAAEMKERIVSYLEDIDSGNIESNGIHLMLPEVLKETDLTFEKAVENASVLLKNIMYNYADFSIMTIDSFFQRILRTFAYDLDIPQNFQLEIDSHEVIIQIVELLIEQVGENEDLTKILVGFVNKSAEESKSWHIEKEILSLTPDLLKEQSKVYVDAIKDLTLADFQQVIKNLSKEKSNLLDKTKIEVEGVISMVEDAGIPSTEFMRNFLVKWVDMVKDERFEISNAIRSALDQSVWFSKPNEKKYGSALKAIEIQLVELMNRIIKEGKRIQFISSVQKKIFPIALLNELKGMLTQVELIEHSFQLSNTNAKLYEVTSQEPTPFIYERLGDKYFYYFIDEFQDTSQLQWLNVLPLICEALSAYHGVEQGKAILFGDPKQAIYRFRGGNVNLFVNLPNVANPDSNPLIAEMEATIKQQYVSKNLDTNYRSYERVVTFNNQLFEFLKGRYPTIAPYYLNHHQKFSNSKQGGFVTVDVMKKNYSDEKKKDQLQNFANQKILLYINDALASGFSYKDIAVLFRDKKNAIEVANFLSQHNIPVISSESLLLSSSLKVLFLISILRLHYQNNDQVLLYSVVMKFCQLFHPEVNVVELSIFSMIDLESFFEKNKIDFKFKDLQSLSLYEKAEVVIRKFSLENVADVYLVTFLNLVFEKNKVFYHEELFWEWWDDNSSNASVEMPDSVNGISLTTVHKSKGLEYPIVICPNYFNSKKSNDIWISLDKDSADSSGLLKVAKMPIANNDDSVYSAEVEAEKSSILIDRVNVLYVALTRAVERLHVIVDCPSATSSSFDVAFELAGFVKDSLLFESIEHENGFSYQYGVSEMRCSSQKKGTTESVKLTEMRSVDWKNNQWISAENESNDAIALGNVFHFAMSKIRNINEVEIALEQLKGSYSLDQSQLELLSDMIHQVVYHAQLNWCFLPESIVYNELEIVDLNGELYRPDRVVEFDEKITIMDFKTGLRSSYHVDQVETYKSLYKQMGKTQVDGFLVYVDDKQVSVEVV